jgi:PDZ domain
MRPLLWISIACVLVGLAGACAYPRRETLTVPAPPAAEGTILEGPEGLYSIRLIGAELPAFKGGGLAWDSDGTGPDPFMRLLLDGRVVWESPPQENTQRPAWNVTLPRNIHVSTTTKFRLELWDEDTGNSDPAGAVTRAGLPESALPNAVARLTLDNFGTISITISEPRASRGVGLRYEERSDGFFVLEVEPFSPAGRAGIRAGDLIVGIAGARVDDLGGDRASSQLSLASDRGSTLTVSTADREREVTLDRGYLWLTM